MKILFLTPELPYPPDRGASIRSFNLIKNLAPRHEIHLLSFSAKESDLAEAGPLLDLCSQIETLPTPHRSTLQRLLPVLLSPLPDMALRLPSSEFESKLWALLQEEDFDVVQVEAIEMARYIPTITESRRPPRLTFDDINAEYLLQRRAFETDLRHLRWLGAVYSLIQWGKLRRYEAWACRRADQVVAVSETDKEALCRLVPGLPVSVVPNGVDTQYYQPTEGETDGSLVFTGKMDFRPNVDGVLWFFERVWPLVKGRLPQARLLVVGRNPSPRLSPLLQDPQVRVTGFVPDVRPYIAQANIYLVPLRMGGGTRLKVLEAMAMGKAIVSTSLGCEGIKTTGQELVIADNESDFAQRVIDLWGDEKRRKGLGVAARRLAKEYDWKVITPLLEQVYEKAA
ncbi:MAG TPA: glycosyl transferase family 1 [Chloroflexi bacterium]|nr:glycosyl transferase family 1 [Chloroflexota bacterium]